MKRFSKALNFPRCFAGTFDHCDLVISSEIFRNFQHIHHLVILNHLKQLYYRLLSDCLSNLESLKHSEATIPDDIWKAGIV